MGPIMLKLLLMVWLCSPVRCMCKHIYFNIYCIYMNISNALIFSHQSPEKINQGGKIKIKAFCSTLRGLVLRIKEAWYDENFMQRTPGSSRHMAKLSFALEVTSLHAVLGDVPRTVFLFVFWPPATTLGYFRHWLCSVSWRASWSLPFSLFATCQVQFSTWRQDVSDFSPSLFLRGRLALKVSQALSP